ncbi:GGDEF domain-containing protein [Thiohalobacter sp. IOR34]|uniref:GGDEF domain-containing protein n=1 Tax=Thiohalobacter sp. IOR34 TaxID=3057176 RepID=UPI0025AF1552|nr:GGDEF domain-containing protein [Thiohalobacter sp. IOR34]WJW75940.1 GGDEF domain-containing protein [Thiohalobacter sp. IOR34]
MQEMQVRELMQAVPATATAQTPLTDILKAMMEQCCSCVVIVEQDVPKGIITERDLVKFVAEGGIPGEALAEAIMTADPASLREDATVFEALVITHSRKIRHLPVVDGGGRLTGLITFFELANAYLRFTERQHEALERSIRQRTAELAEANERLLALSMTDALLGIGNRRAMEIDLDHTLAAARRYHRSCCVILVDVDFFKRYNDRYGHTQGDEALRQVGRHLQEGIRRCDRLYRYGGEELLILTPETDLEGAALLARRLVESLHARGIEHAESPFGVLTLSAGIGCLPAGPEMTLSRQGLIDRADQALYAAKHGGRNRVVASPD